MEWDHLPVSPVRSSLPFRAPEGREVRRVETSRIQV